MIHSIRSVSLKPSEQSASFGNVVLVGRNAFSNEKRRCQSNKLGMLFCWVTVENFLWTRQMTICRRQMGTRNSMAKEIPKPNCNKFSITFFMTPKTCGTARLLGLTDIPYLRNEWCKMMFGSDRILTFCLRHGI